MNQVYEGIPTGIIPYVVDYGIDPDTELLRLHLRMPTGEEHSYELCFVADGVHPLVFWVMPPDDALVSMISCQPSTEDALKFGAMLTFNAGGSQRAVEMTRLLLPHIRVRDLTRLPVYREPLQDGLQG